MEANRLTPADVVTTQVYSPSGEMIGEKTSNGYRDIREAIDSAFEASAPAGADIRDYVFKVTDDTEGISSRYRINDHGNLKLIV